MSTKKLLYGLQEKITYTSILLFTGEHIIYTNSTDLPIKFIL